MQDTSVLYNSIISGDHRFEVSLAIGESGRLITKLGDVILFGGTAILVDTGGAENGFRMERLISVRVTSNIFSSSMPDVGSCVSSEIDVEMLRPPAEIPKRARLALYVRAVNDTQQSEWLPQGIFYIDTREYSQDSDLSVMKIHGYDSMVFADADYPSSSIAYPATDRQILGEIANAMGVTIDPRTYDIMVHDYEFPLPVGYSMREVLGILASAYGGNFIITESGALRLIAINEIPKPTNYLIDENGFVILFGGDRIRV